jgi:hypothetical protein
MTNEELNARINELWTATKRGELPRQARFAAIEQLTEEYIAATGRRPDPAMLDRLATLCLYEEVTDATPWKTRNTERPIHSERQRRTIEEHEAGSRVLDFVESDGRLAKKQPRSRW